MILERIYSSCCQNASPLFWDLSGAGSWLAESITDAILSLQWGSLSAADESATGTAFWLSLFQQPYSCRFYVYIFIFLIFFTYYFCRMLQKHLIPLLKYYLDGVFETGFVRAIVLLWSWKLFGFFNHPLLSRQTVPASWQKGSSLLFGISYM